jgi:hypothetical protein
MDCEQIQDDETNLQLETTFRDFSLTWYMKLQASTPVDKNTLAKIRTTLIDEFKKPNYES